MSIAEALLAAPFVHCDTCQKVTKHKVFIGGVQMRILFLCQECACYVADDEADFYVSLANFNRIMLSDLQKGT